MSSVPRGAVAIMLLKKHEITRVPIGYYAQQWNTAMFNTLKRRCWAPKKIDKKIFNEQKKTTIFNKKFN